MFNFLAMIVSIALSILVIYFGVRIIAYLERKFLGTDED